MPNTNTVSLRLNDQLYSHLIRCETEGVSEYIRNLINKDMTEKRKQEIEKRSEEWNEVLSSCTSFLKYVNIEIPKEDERNNKYLEKFRPYAYQYKLLSTLNNNLQLSPRLSDDYSDVLIIKSGAIGITTLFAILTAWSMLVNDNFTILFKSTNSHTAINFNKKVRTIFDNLPLWMQPSYADFNKLDILLQNGSKVLSSHDYNSEADLLIVDEYSHINVEGDDLNDDIVYVHDLLNINDDTRLLVSSNSLSENSYAYQYFYNKLNEDTKIITLPWTCITGRDEQWKNEMENSMGSEQFKKEYGAIVY